LAALAGAFVSVAPLRSAAFGFIEIFEPRQVAFIPMTVNDFKEMSALPDFEDFGTASQLLASQEHETGDVRLAASLARYPLRLPDGSATGAAFSVSSPALEQFVFSEAKARESAARKGEPWQPMPYGMDGSVVRVAFGAMVIARFETGFGSVAGPPQPAPVAHNRIVLRGRMGRTVLHQRDTVYVVGSRTRSGRFNGALFVAQMPIPKVGSTGISMAQIERYMVDRPGVPPRLAAAFASLRDPSSTLPIPLPVDKQYARQVAVDGVVGTLIGDETGLGSVVFWQRGGFVYAVAGTHSAGEIVAIANSLR
jgi:hypothetical protein